MFKAQAVWKTAQEEEFTPAGFDLMVDVEPVSTNVMPDSMELMMTMTRDQKCDGFIIDLGNGTERYFIKS
jgi:hypothetical protein